MSQSIIKNPHDNLFKASLKHPPVAQEFLSLYLPDDIKKDLDFNQISYCSTQFINAQLKESEADVLLKTMVAGQAAYIYILAEQQTTVDKLMPLRLLHYMTCIWNDHCKQMGRKNALPLPLIFPLVFYTGPGSYRGLRTVWELCGDKSSEMQKILQSPFHLIDVSLLPDEELTPHVWAGTLGFILREKFKKDVYNGIKKVAANLSKIGLEEKGQLLLELFSYILNIQINREQVSFDKLMDSVREQLSSEMEANMANKNMASFAQVLREEGELKGRLAGIVEGEYTGRIEIAKEMLAAGSDIAFIVKVTHLPAETIKKLQEKISVME
jgi:predicted transposase/invertase (TIGR01784 family)